MCPGHGRAARTRLPNQTGLTGSSGCLEQNAVLMRLAAMVLIVLLALAVVAGCVWIWSRIASGSVARSKDGATRRFDTTMGELRDMREALRSAERFRQVPIRHT